MTEFLPVLDSSLAGRPAGELARLVSAGLVSATEVVADHLDRIAALNPQLNAFVHVATEAALADAAAVDAARARGERLGPLAGVPFSVKDVISVAGMPFTAGSRALAGHLGTEDAPSVARLRAAGAICLGKTNTPEFALWTLTWNELFGYTANPLPRQLDRSPGGSSGGEAAAVAAGLSAFGLGSDFGGSVRWPAHCTGLSSLRPTPGVVDSSGQLPGSRTHGQWRLAPGSLQAELQVVGPMARSVADVQLVTDVLADRGAGRGAAAPAPGRDPAPDLAEVRMGWCRGEGTTPVAAPIVEAVATVADLLGQDLVRAVPETAPAALAEAAGLFREVRATDPTADIRAHLGAADPGPVIRTLLDAEQPVGPGLVASLRSRVRDLRERMLSQMPDVLLMPVAAIGAPGLTERSFEVDGTVLGPWEVLACSQAISLFALPSAVTPVGTFPDGRTIGVQVVGRPGSDDLVLTVARHLETLRAEQA